MTKLAIIILGLALAYAPVHAQEQPPRQLFLAHDCAPIDVVIPLLKEIYGEYPFAIGTAVVNLPKDQLAQGMLMMSVNPDTRTYTINIFFEEENMSCMLTSGIEFQPIDLTPTIEL